MTWRHVLVALLLLGALLYASWLLGFVLENHVDPRYAYTSELDSADRPYGAVFRIGDLLTGVVLTVAAALGLLTRPRRSLTTVGWAGLTLFAVGTVIDSRVPFTCPPVAPGCEARNLAGELALAHQWHTASSGAAIVGAAISLVAFARAAYRYGWPSWLRRLGTVVVAVFILGTVWTIIAGALAGLVPVWPGLAQRVQLAAMSGWLVFVALSVPEITRDGGGIPDGST